MLRKLLISLLLFPFLIYCDDESQVELLSDRFQASSGIVAGCVNVVTGNYFLVETDLYNPGPVPIVYQRFYNSGSPNNRGGRSTTSLSPLIEKSLKAELARPLRITSTNLGRV